MILKKTVPILSNTQMGFVTAASAKVNTAAPCASHSTHDNFFPSAHLRGSCILVVSSLSLKKSAKVGLWPGLGETMAGTPSWDIIFWIDDVIFLLKFFKD